MIIQPTHSTLRSPPMSLRRSLPELLIQLAMPTKQTMAVFAFAILIPAIFFAQNIIGQEWSAVQGGLQMRVLAVPPETDEQSATWNAEQKNSSFATAADVTLIVEVKNASEETISIQGVRWGDSISGPSKGTSATESLASFLFSCELIDRAGNPIDSPANRNDDDALFMTLHSGAAEPLEPGHSCVMLVHPLRWDAALANEAVAGDYSLRVRYSGMPEKSQEQIREHWPDNPLIGSWHGELVSEPVAISLAGPLEESGPDLVWGEANNAIRVAAVYRLRNQELEVPGEYAERIFPIDSQIDVEFHIQNVSTKTVTFSSEPWRQDDSTWLVGPGPAGPGKQHLQSIWYSGGLRFKDWELKPKQIAIIPAMGIAVSENGNNDEFEHPIGVVITGPPDEYPLMHELSIRSVEDHNEIFQVPTGVTKIKIRERTANDSKPKFTTVLKLERPDGTFADSGYVRVTPRNSQQVLYEDTISAAGIEISGCTDAELSVYQRIPGCAAARFNSVKPDADNPVIIQLAPSHPIKLRLVDRAGSPVKDAKIRLFNTGKENASSHPFPMQGTDGDVYCTTDETGSAVIDYVQKNDPAANEALGGNRYWFFVEPPELAPIFVGPLEAGTDAGEIVVGPFLEVRGEIHGTPERLANFAAEWDQPAVMVRGDGSNWLYAVSRKLEVKRERDKTVFRLTGLRSGPLRIIATFAPRPHAVAKTYGRREVGENDKLFEFELTDSRDDLIIQADDAKTAVADDDDSH